MGRQALNLPLDSGLDRRDNGDMRTFLWPVEDGWPYPDTEPEEIDFRNELDDDLMALADPASHVYDRLEPLEREVIGARFGIAGHAFQSIAELGSYLGVPEATLSEALGSGLAKLRAQLTG